MYANKTFKQVIIFAEFVNQAVAYIKLQDEKQNHLLQKIF